MRYIIAQIIIGALAAVAAWCLTPFTTVVALSILSGVVGAVAVWRA